MLATPRRWPLQYEKCVAHRVRFRIYRLTGCNSRINPQAL
jgi:hypothetical protein